MGRYSCTVGTDEYTPPSLIGATFASIDRNQHHDSFAAGVLLFRTLMEGTHPYAARYQGNGEPPTLLEKIRHQTWPYQHNNSLVPPTGAPPIDLLTPTLQRLFAQCFCTPQPPTIREWQAAITEYRHNLTVCRERHNHYYPNHRRNCPWCERTNTFSTDPFPQRMVCAFLPRMSRSLTLHWSVGSQTDALLNHADELLTPWTTQR